MGHRVQLRQEKKMSGSGPGPWKRGLRVWFLPPLYSGQSTYPFYFCFCKIRPLGGTFHDFHKDGMR